MGDEQDLNNLAVRIIDPKRYHLAMNWLTMMERYAREWDIVKNGGRADRIILNELPLEEFHAIDSFGALFGTGLDPTIGIDQIAAYNRARELAEEQEEPWLMDSYVRLTLANEIMARLKDGRLVLVDVYSPREMVLVAPASR